MVALSSFQTRPCSPSELGSEKRGVRTLSDPRMRASAMSLPDVVAPNMDTFGKVALGSFEQKRSMFAGVEADVMLSLCQPETRALRRKQQEREEGRDALLCGARARTPLQLTRQMMTQRALRRAREKKNGMFSRLLSIPLCKKCNRRAKKKMLVNPGYQDLGFVFPRVARRTHPSGTFHSNHSG